MTTEQKRPAALPAARPKAPSAVSNATQKIGTVPIAPKAVVSAGSPRPPAVAPSEPRLPEPSSPSVVTEVHSGMAPIAIEAALAELGTWRRDAERKIARLEAEVAELQASPRAVPPSPPKEPLPPWAHTPLAPAVAPVMIPAAAATPASLAATDPAYGPSDPIPIVNAREAPTMPPSHPPRSVHAVYYDLDLRPGETVDLPSQLDAGRRKRMLGWLALLFIVGGMIALVAASAVSQR